MAISILKENISAKVLKPSFTFRIILSCIMANSGCNKDKTSDPVSSYNKNYEVVKLVSDESGTGSLTVDENLVNPWGIAMSTDGQFWIPSSNKHVCAVYNKNGSSLISPINIEGNPTGVVSNHTSAFINPFTHEASKYIYAADNGLISVWSFGSSAQKVIDRSAADAVYRGITIADDKGESYLYAANFKGGHIEVFDKNFNLITTKPFEDGTLPKGFVPFNIQNIDGMLYVSYAKSTGPLDKDIDSGAGLGFVNVFRPDGIFVKRFASGGNLNAPWGITKAPGGFGQISHAILIGNFGDGHINVFDANGTYIGQLNNNNTPIEIQGLRALCFTPDNTPVEEQRLFFTSAPGQSNHGLFGFIKRK